MWFKEKMKKQKNKTTTTKNTLDGTHLLTTMSNLILLDLLAAKRDSVILQYAYYNSIIIHLFDISFMKSTMCIILEITLYMEKTKKKHDGQCRLCSAFHQIKSVNNSKKVNNLKYWWWYRRTMHGFVWNVTPMFSLFKSNIKQHFCFEIYNCSV